jgi:phosphoglycolate phosphatase-like HAD superfamily hydrolase
MIRAVLYDLDGVIVDSKTTVVEALREVAGLALGILPPAAQVRRLAYLPPVQVLTELGVTDAALVFDANFDTAYARHACKSRLVAGMTAAMWRIRMAGRSQAIVTLQRRHRLNLLPLGEVPDLIDTIVCFEDATPKPAPDPLWLALDQLQIPREHACFIGDTASDIQAGKAAGIPTYGVVWGYRDAATLRDAGADGLLVQPADVVGMVLAEPTVTVGYASSATGVTVRSGSSP